MAQHNDTGKWGEDIAADYLVQNGYSIVERNWRIDHKEIDIIATDGRMLLFVEVKTRSTENYGSPYESVDWRKAKNLLSAMRRYMGINRVTMPVRFDIISITGSPSYYKLEQLENAVTNFIY